ncbi:hypothetical protein LAV72_04050 [Lysinibacillus xylanilyticus]|uniref:hypothetical protein n=1 Tax=Lysinibacillus xylanilyticus TaxID=582475 RepID=UPI002B2437B3|nr:hypothetical protein [Lysinibacillus xylanilyticus]MEB2298798.1 hypothetical protein [Lysinibacillus xylanilyticus]
MFKKNIMVGHSVDTLLEITEHLKSCNIPFDIGIKDILKSSSERFRSKKNDEVYNVFYTVKVRREYMEQVEAIVAQYVSEDVKHLYKMSKKKSRKLEEKENLPYTFFAVIIFIALEVIHAGKSGGSEIISYIGCAVLSMAGVFTTAKYYIEMQEESGISRLLSKMLIIIGIGMIFYAVYSFLSVFRF